MDTNNDMLNSDATTPLTSADTTSVEDSSCTDTNDVGVDADTSTTIPGSSSPPTTVTDSTIPSFNDTGVDAEKGPLGRLSERAYQSALAQKANDKIPSSVRPILKRGAEGADRAIAAVDETLQTDEAQRVAGSAVDLFRAMSAFTLMVLSATVSHFETVLNIPSRSPSPSPSSPTNTDSQSQGESERNSQREKAHELLLRCKSVVLACFHTLLQKKNVSSSETSTDDQQGQRESRYDPHSIDKVVLNNVKHGVHFVKKAGAYSLSQASQFTGPGSSAIAPTADYIISKLPEDAQRVVSETSSLFQ